jgi:hypothetical protein
VTQALAADSLGEFADQPFVDPLFQAVHRPDAGPPVV